MYNHCCREMAQFTSDPRVQIIYLPRVREYYIPLKSQIAVQTIYYCPWCGKKLPDGLDNKLDEILKEDYNIKANDDFEKTPGLPEEFKTDEWWKKRGL